MVCVVLFVVTFVWSGIDVAIHGAGSGPGDAASGRVGVRAEKVRGIAADGDITRQASYLLLTCSMLFGSAMVASLSRYTYWRICMLALALVFGVAISAMVSPSDACVVMVLVAVLVCLAIPVGAAIDGGGTHAEHRPTLAAS